MVVVAVIGLLCAMVIPNLVRARERAQLSAIQGNLRIIEYAKDQWALENRKGTGEPIPSVATISNYIKYGALRPVVGETYTPNAIGTMPIAIAPVPLLSYGKGTPIMAPPE